VRLTSALLADAATLCDGKLYLHGAGWDVINTPGVPVTHPALALALIIEMQATELAEGAALEVRLVAPDGQPAGVNATGRLSTPHPAQVASSSRLSVPAALNFPAVTFTRAGEYRFVISVGGTELDELKFTVRLV
jgi:hypothetical protein